MQPAVTVSVGDGTLELEDVMVEIHGALAAATVVQGLVGRLGFVTAAVTAVVLMIRLGVTRGMLDARSETRRCAACGRPFNGRACADCTRHEP